MQHAHSQTDQRPVMGTGQLGVPDLHAARSDALHPDVHMIRPELVRSRERGVGEGVQRQGDEGLLDGHRTSLAAAFALLRVTHRGCIGGPRGLVDREASRSQGSTDLHVVVHDERDAAMSGDRPHQLELEQPGGAMVAVRTQQQGPGG